MNPISKAVSDLYFRIPKDILNRVFKPHTHKWRNDMVTTSEMIINKVVRNRVLVDCSLVGGTEITISLLGLTPERVSLNEIVYYIPKDLTQGRAITSVLSIGNNYLNTMGMATGFNLGNDLVNAGKAMMLSNSSAPIISNSRVQLIAENTVLLTEDIALGYYNTLRCVIEDDPNLSNLNRRAYITFAKLVELAVKSYIYNELVIQMDQGMLIMGKELGSFKQIVDSYSEAETMYQEYLVNQWAATAFLNDQVTTSRYIKMQLGPYV